MAAANRDSYDRIIVITDGHWRYSDTITVQGYGEGDPQTIATCTAYEAGILD